MATEPIIESDLDLISQEGESPDPYDKVEDIVKSIVDQIDMQERPSRQVLIRLWKYLDLLWSGISNFYWNTAANEWRVITQDDIRNLGDSIDVDSSLLNKTINLIRPYGESLIGVLTTATPRIKFFPEDADKVEDIKTAKVSSIIEKRIADDNNIKARVIEILVRLWNNGFAAIYNYSHKSPDYGIVSKPIYGDVNYDINSQICPDCGGEISSDKVKSPPSSTEEAVPDSGVNVQSSPIESLDLSPSTEEESVQEAIVCPQCANTINPLMEQSQITENEVIGNVDLPKSKQILKVYGPLNVKIPVKATCKEEIIFCILEEDIHESQAKALYPEYWDKIVGGESSADLGIDRWARSQYENMAETNQHYVTIRKVWLRPTAYAYLGDKEKYDQLLALYPKGLVAVFSGSDYLYCEESLIDEHWTFSFNPLYYRVYGDPLAKASIPLQEVANDLFQLEVETVRYAIPQTWVDPQHVDLEAYSKSRAVPGSMSGIKVGASAGKSISDLFYETKPATLPNEVEVLDKRVDYLFQFITGVLPPVFGGTQSGGSKTLGEVEQNRNQALQRLANPWYVVNMMYAECMAKAVKAYRDDLLEDENVVEAKGDSFINTWVRTAEITGKVGRVVPEVGDQFPVSWAQKKAVFMELMTLNNEMINSFLAHPENIGLIADYIVGVDGLYIPGEDQRNKQLVEIMKMISVPIPTEEELAIGIPIPPPMPIPIESIDNDEVHIQVIEAFLCSDRGQELKDTNPIAYQSIMMHYEMHGQRLALALAAQAETEAQNNEDNSKPVGESNV